MKQKIGRNDPCPCGSGKKYKKCCLRRERQEDLEAHAEERSRNERNAAAEHAMDWLVRNHRDAIVEVLDEIYHAVPEPGRALTQSDEEYLSAVAGEWALAEGVAEIDGKPLRLRDLVLDQGPTLTADQRRWLDASTAQRLRLFRAGRVEPGVGFELEPMLDEEPEAIWVKERSASKSVQQGDVVAARLVEWEGDHEIMMIYSIPEKSVQPLLDLLDTHVGDVAADEAMRRESVIIRDFWVHSFTKEVKMPSVFDMAGERVELTTDHWDILDADQLEKRLAAQPDVEGDPERGWARLKDPEAEMPSTLLALNPGKRDDRLESFARTRTMAEEGKRWLEEVAGPCLRFITREIVDPTSPKVLGPEAKRPSSSPPPSPPDVPPEIMVQMMEQVYKRQYEGIADQEIPALGGSPREALADAKGRRKARAWLEGLEANERRMAEQQGRPLVDMGFVWREVGLERGG